MGILGAVLRPFGRKYPKVSLRIIERLLPTLESGLSQGHVDLYVVPFPEGIRPRELLISKIFANERIVIGRKGHPLSGASKLAISL